MRRKDKAEADDLYERLDKTNKKQIEQRHNTIALMTTLMEMIVDNALLLTYS